jgi:hypothetical protein
MTFDNSRTIIIQRIKIFIVMAVGFAYFILAYGVMLIRFPFLGLGETVCALIVVGVSLLVVLIPILLSYQYISYSDEGESILLRYFQSGIFGGKKNSVEIKKELFSGYKTESKFFGLIQTISLFQKYKEGVAKYPPVYISALTRKQRAKMLRSLDLLFPRP